MTLSPDGDRIAYPTETGKASNVGDLEVAKNDGTDRQVVWDFKAEAQGAPAWNPAGTLLAVTVRGITYSGGPPPPGSTPAGLWVVDIKRRHAQQVSSDALGPVTWDPTGTTIAYATATDPPQLQTVPLTGGPPNQLEINAAAGQRLKTLSWSPDGRSILVSLLAGQMAPSSVQKISLGGRPPMVVLQGSPGADDDNAHGITYDGAIYSPDGKHFAVAVGCYTQTCQLMPDSRGQKLEIVELDGSQPRTLDTGGNRADLAPTCWVREPGDFRNPTSVATTTPFRTVPHPTP